MRARHIIETADRAKEFFLEIARAHTLHTLSEGLTDDGGDGVFGDGALGSSVGAAITMVGDNMTAWSELDPDGFVVDKIFSNGDGSELLVHFVRALQDPHVPKGVGSMRFSAGTSSITWAWVGSHGARVPSTEAAYAFSGKLRLIVFFVGEEFVVSADREEAD